MMKTINLTIGFAIVILATACSSSHMVSSGVYYDDVYYVPGATKENLNEAFSPVPAMSDEAKKAANNEFLMQQKEYQKTQNTEKEDNRDFSALQEKYASLLSDDSIQETDSLVYYDDETGYWVNGFDGSSMDRDYAERMIRFHGPFIGIPYYSPAYSEIVYFNNYDWNVYVDGNYAYAFPTWTNRWYSSLYFNSWGYPGLSFGLSWGYPYYNSWGIGFGWDPFFYSSYYSSWYYPWYNPCYYPHHGGGWHHGPEQGYSNRNYSRSNMRPDLNSNTRTKSEATISSRSVIRSSTGENVKTTNSGTRITRDQSGNTTYQNADGTVYTRSNRADAGTQSTTATGTETIQRSNTRKSYTPSYSKPEGNSRPTYNRTSYTRVSGTRTAQTTGTVQSSNSGTRQVQSSASRTTPGSTSTTTRSSSGSSATNTRATTTRATTTYQQGSSSRSSSGSYSTPSRSSSTSSGSSGYSSGSSRSYSTGSSSSGSSSRSSSGSGSSSGGTVRQGRR